MRNPLALALLLSLTAAARAAVIDDSELSTPALSAQSAAGLALEGRAEFKARIFALDVLGPSGVSTKGAGAVTGRLILLDRTGAPHPARLAKARLGDGEWTQVGDDGRFSLHAPAAGASKVRFSLDGPRWNFRSDNGDAYEWESLPAGAGTDLGTLMPAAGSENAKLGVLHLTYLEAVDFLAREATIDWWKEPLTVVWPGGSDYFSPGEWTLHLTNPEAWDIVLHELGHAVMNGSMVTHTSGGSHKIDECYSEGLAWSEGWASFFAAAVRLSPDDADAKFEFMVPRRAPIRVENVPADVCQGPASEWRVFSGLWDLYDRHDDGLDRVSLGFGPIWKGVTSGESSSVLDGYRLIAAGLEPAAKALADDAMRQNTLLPAKPLSAKVSRRAVPRPLPLTATRSPSTKLPEGAVHRARPNAAVDAVVALGDHLVVRGLRRPAVVPHAVQRDDEAGPVFAMGAMDEHGLIRGVVHEGERAVDQARLALVDPEERIERRAEEGHAEAAREVPLLRDALGLLARVEKSDEGPGPLEAHVGAHAAHRQDPQRRGGRPRAAIHAGRDLREISDEARELPGVDGGGGA